MSASPPPPVRRQPPVLLLAGGATLVYLGLFYGADAVVRLQLLRHLPGLELLPVERRELLVGEALARQVLTRTANLGLPMVLLIIGLAWADGRSPLRAMGLAPQPGSLRASLVAAAAGTLAGLGLLLLAAVFSTTSPAAFGRLVGRLAGHPFRSWLDNGWLGVTALIAVVGCYTLARLLVPFGYLAPLLRRKCPPALTTGLPVVLFAAPYGLLATLTPLAGFNVLLLGLVLERWQARTGSLWPPLLGWSGWIAVAELSGQAHQGSPSVAEPLFTTLPALLSGGGYGLEGGLLTSLMLSLGLVLLLRPPARGQATGPESEPSAR